MKLLLQSGRASEGRRRLERHGMYGTSEWLAWRNMRDRCINPKSKDYPRYGGRGLKIWPPWKRSFKSFFKHIGPKPSAQHSLGRKDNNLGYVPGNVEWETKKQQDNNRRSTRLIDFGGVRCSMAEWDDALGLRKDTVRHRLRSGWTMKDIIADVKAKQELQSMAEAFPFEPWDGSDEWLPSPAVLDVLELLMA